MELRAKFTLCVCLTAFAFAECFEKKTSDEHVLSNRTLQFLFHVDKTMQCFQPYLDDPAFSPGKNKSRACGVCEKPYQEFKVLW